MSPRSEPATTHLPLQELAYEVPGVGSEVRRQVELPLEDLLDGLLAVLGREGRRARQHVVHERAQRPPVDGLAVAGPQQDLGRHVLDGAAEGVRDGLLVDRLLAEAKVGQLDVAVGVE